LSNASGTGSGVVSLSAQANSSGASQTAFVTLNGQDIAIIQPATACSYALGTTQIQAPAAGVSGSIAVTTTCPIVANPSQSWIATAVLPSSVGFTIAANTGGSARTGSITIGDQLAQTTQSASSAMPGATLSPSGLTFASQAIGSISAVQSVTLTNSGQAALSLTSIATSGDFAQTNTCGTTVAAGASCTIAVAFTPTAAGSRTGNVTVIDNTNGSPQLVALSGIGIVPVAAAATLSPTSLNFAAQAIGSTSSVQVVTLTNSGQASLALASISTSGDFAQTNTCGTTVAAGANCTISVTFTPTAVGPRTGTLTITDNVASSPQTISLSGMGSGFNVSTSSTGLTISASGGSASTNIQLSSVDTFSGAANLTCSIAYQGTGTVTGPPTCSFTPAQVQVSPVGSSSATLTVNTTASSGSALFENNWLKLSGEALAAVFFFGIVPRRRWRGCLAILCIAAVSTMIGCGGGNSSSGSGGAPTIPGTTTGSYVVTITVKAVTGTDSATITLPLSVQ
jgi:hypothetical protein